MEFVNEEISSYAVEKFFFEIQKANFDREAYTRNPMGCLNRFFKHRFNEGCRSEMSRVERNTRSDVTPSGWDRIESHYVGPDQELLVAEVREAYTNAVNQLPYQLSVVVAKMRQGKKVPQIAEEIGIEVTAVYEARRKIKKHLRVALSALAGFRSPQ